MDFTIENDRSTDADVGWYVNNLAYNAEKYLVYSFPEFFCINFFKTNNKKVATNAS